MAWSCGAGQTAWRRGLFRISRAIRSHSHETGHASDIFQIIKGNSKELSSWLILEKGTLSCRIWSVPATAEGQTGRASGHIPAAPRAARVAWLSEGFNWARHYLGSRGTSGWIFSPGVKSVSTADSHVNYCFPQSRTNCTRLPACYTTVLSARAQAGWLAAVSPADPSELWGQ